MSTPRPPKNLPRGYRPIWKALSIADQRVASRQALANDLGVATHTIQRILVDGKVPRFPETKNVRITHAWVRSLTRLATKLGASPREWIEGVGIQWDTMIREVSESALTKAPSPARRRRPAPKGKIPDGWPKDELSVALGSVRPYADPLATFHTSFLAIYARRIVGAIDPSLRLDVRTMHESDAVDALVADGSVVQLAIGVLDIVQRRATGLEFSHIPGCRIRLGAVGLREKGDSRPLPSWSQVVPPARAPHSFLVPEGGVAEYFLRGQCGFPPDRLVSVPRRSTQLAADFLAECRKRDHELLFVSTEDECGNVLRTLPSLSEFDESYRAQALEGSPNEFPSYPLSIAWPSHMSEWARHLQAARDLELFENSNHLTALLYADLLATSYLRPLGPGVPAVGWDAPFADRIGLTPRAGRAGWSPVASFAQASTPFLESLCLRLVAILSDGMTAQLAARLEVGRPEENRSRIIERMKREAPHLVPGEWTPQLIRTLEKVATGTRVEAHGAERRRQSNCDSCSALLADGIHGGVSDRYCRFCSDESGRLKPRQDVEDLLSRWIGNWDRRLGPAEARERASAYMEKMPAWSGN